ncbi:MAG: hypothetical protein ACSHX9_15680 [Luteolibacter sp.]
MRNRPQRAAWKNVRVHWQRRALARLRMQSAGLARVILPEKGRCFTTYTPSFYTGGKFGLENALTGGGGGGGW